jgi:phenylalanyl-tRNA synthetase alpha chain
MSGVERDEDLLREVERLEGAAREAIGRAGSLHALEQARVAWLGRKSRVSELMTRIPTLTGEARGAFGKRLNQAKTAMEAALTERRTELAGEASNRQAIDVTLPGSAMAQGRLHPITQTIQRILEAFVPLGFEIVEGPEAEFERYNFDALNIPKEHPSRESFDTFFLDTPSPEPSLGRVLLRSHTSPVQVRVMERRKPPLRILVPGTVYRPDPLDASHSFMFHQVEGLAVDDHTSFADLKGCVSHGLRVLFGPDTRTRFRPHYFPFTEPSAEVDIACVACDGRGCSTCGRKGWLEIMGCGMVHPHVFKAVGYDPRVVQGFAFGMGVERIAMLRHRIPDIRLFFENDLRFLEQF